MALFLTGGVIFSYVCGYTSYNYVIPPLNKYIFKKRYGKFSIPLYVSFILLKYISVQIYRRKRIIKKRLNSNNIELEIYQNTTTSKIFNLIASCGPPYLLPCGIVLYLTAFYESFNSLIFYKRPNAIYLALQDGSNLYYGKTEETSNKTKIKNIFKIIKDTDNWHYELAFALYDCITYTIGYYSSKNISLLTNSVSFVARKIYEKFYRPVIPPDVINTVHNEQYAWPIHNIYDMTDNLQTVALYHLQ